MLQHHLYSVFHPHTLAVVGASDRYGTAGRSVFSQLLVQNNITQLIPVNPKHKFIGSLKAYESLTDAAKDYAIDGVMVVVSADKLIAIVREAVKIGAKNIIIINELDPSPSAVRKQLERASEIAKKAGVSLFAIPVHGVEGLLATPKRTALAFVGHGEDIADGLNHYARERGIEFSRFLLLNPQRDYSPNTGQLIDYIGNEPTSIAVLVQVSLLDNANELLSALTALAKRKPVVVLSTIANAREEALFLQALERNRILWVSNMSDFFTAAKLMHTRVYSRGRRLAIVSNTPQINALIFKEMLHENIEAAQPSLATQRTIARLLPYKPEQFNPLSLPVDAAPGLFQAALEATLNDENIDAVLLMYSGRNLADNQRTAQIAVQLQQKTRKPLLLVWLGSVNTPEIRLYFSQNRNLHFRQPEHALQGFLHLNTYRDTSQLRYALSSFHDYRASNAAAELVRKYLRPILPMVAVPASKFALSRLLAALKVERATRKTMQPDLFFQWENHDTLGQVLTLITEHNQRTLLPPITPNQVHEALIALNRQPEIWQTWLLNASDLLNRLPEIHYVQLELCVENHKILSQEHKCTLQEERSKNVFTPYPADEEVLTLKNGQLAFLRPVRQEDADLLRVHIEHMSDEARFTRFLSRFKTPPLSLLSRLSNVDYQRDYALLVQDEHNTVLATANYITDSALRACEFGISTNDDLHGQGLGALLMQRLIKRARAQGLTYIYAEMLDSNIGMQKLAQKLGFALTPHEKDKHMLWAKLDL